MVYDNNNNNKWCNLTINCVVCESREILLSVGNWIGNVKRIPEIQLNSIVIFIGVVETFFFMKSFTEMQNKNLGDFILYIDYRGNNDDFLKIKHNFAKCKVRGVARDY